MNTNLPAPFSHEWSDPVPLEKHERPSFDLSKCIPPGLAVFRQFCEGVAEDLQVPPDAVPPLAVALASIGTARALEIELQAGWVETAPLWFVVLGEPGERKSALLSLLAKPVHEWENRQIQYLQPALASYDEDRRLLEARREGVRKKLQTAKDGERQRLEQEALELTGKLEDCPSLAVPALVTTNATPEAMRDLLVRNGEKLALVSSETDAGQLLGARYANGGAPNLDLFLASFTGHECPSHRVGRDAKLKRPALVLALFVQPAALKDVIGDRAARGRGLVDRMALVQPPSRQGQRALHPAQLSRELLGWWNETLHRLLDLPWPGRVMLDPEGPTRWDGVPRILRLAPGAIPILDKLRADLEIRQREGGDLHPVSGFTSKLPGVVARISLALQVMQDAKAEEVSAESMRAAVAWAPVLLGHFRSILGEAAEPEELTLARRLLAALKRQQLREISERDALRLLDGNGKRMDEVRPALDVLVDRGWLWKAPAEAESLPRSGRRPGPRFLVHPAALA
jgi:hypothetical protein